MSLRVVTGPQVEPVSLTDMKLHLREDGPDQDALISVLIEAAREYAENYTRRAFVTQTLELGLPCFPSDGIIQLPRPPLQSVLWVKYTDANGVLQTMPTSDYQIDTFREPALIKPSYLTTWYLSTRNDFNAVQVRYVAGYTGAGSPTPDDYLISEVPSALKAWLKVRVATLYEHRESFVLQPGANPISLPRDLIDGLLDSLVVNIIG
jgi:uncharacterized phiE125 gp8 family phage protein